MKKKLKRAIKTFFQPTNKIQNEYSNIYDEVEKLQYRIEELEVSQGILLREVARLGSKFETRDS